MSFEIAIAEIDRRIAELEQNNIWAQERADQFQSQIDNGQLEGLRDTALAEIAVNIPLIGELQSARALLDAAFDKKEDGDGGSTD